MRTQTEQSPELEYGQAELTTYLPGQERPFTIRGEESDLRDVYETIHARETREYGSPTMQRGKAVIEASAKLVDPIKTVLGRIGLDLQAVAYDRVHGTALYDAVRQRRADERNLRMATKLGLISSTRCMKHEKAVAAIRGIV